MVDLKTRRRVHGLRGRGRHRESRKVRGVLCRVSCPRAVRDSWFWHHSVRQMQKVEEQMRAVAERGRAVQTMRGTGVRQVVFIAGLLYAYTSADANLLAAECAYTGTNSFFSESGGTSDSVVQLRASAGVLPRGTSRLSSIVCTKSKAC